MSSFLELWTFVFVPVPGVALHVKGKADMGPREWYSFDDLLDVCVFYLVLEGLKVGSSWHHTPGSLSVTLHFHSLPLFATPALQACFSMKETGKIAENNPIPIRFTLHNKHLFGHCLDCHFSENLLFD